MNIFGFQAGNFFVKLTWFRVIYRWKWIKSLTIEDRATKVVPKVSIFSGKAAPGTPHLGYKAQHLGYYTAKLIIKLVNRVSAVVNADSDTNKYLKG